jgi:hypothetical protein
MGLRRPRRGFDEIRGEGAPSPSIFQPTIMLLDPRLRPLFPRPLFWFSGLDKNPVMSLSPRSLF